MKIVYAKEFAKEFKKLPVSVQRLVPQARGYLRGKLARPKAQGQEAERPSASFSFRITRSYRVLFLFVDSDTALFATIGHRKDVYD
jgi:mRNA-degrading endonuclease RelE of RelBE toxin-antitoxin system